MNIWDLILRIKQEAHSISADCNFMSIQIKPKIKIGFDSHLPDASFSIALTGHSAGTKGAFRSAPLQITACDAPNISKEDQRLLELYLPYALLPYYARKEQKCYAISHFAQTLDGRIASFSGDSKWIGNQENLIHAHRMRALCDAILIGSKTLDIDDPRLNVRLVNGSDPIKVILGGDALKMEKYKAYDDSIIMFCQNHTDQTLMGEKIIMEKKTGYDTKAILNCLFERGIYSVYIEGGSYTTSNFLRERSIDQVQLHISPKILGSGTSSFCFDGVLNMEEAISFSNGQFMLIGNDMMFLGNLT